jgi:Transglycosylase-like domain
MAKRFWAATALATCMLMSFQASIGVVQASVVKSAEDPTRNLSKEERKKISFEVWVNSPTAKYVKEAESHNNCKSTGGNGKYQGTWQVNAGFWKTYGGKKYASKASKATCREQDLVAYQGWLARGWSPWPPAKNFKP